MASLLSEEQVLIKADLTRASLRYYLSINNFPKPIKIGGVVAGWRESDVDAWLRSVNPETWDPKKKPPPCM